MSLQHNGRIMPKRIHVRIEHVKPSRCKEEFLKRSKENDEIKHAAKGRGGEPSKHQAACPLCLLSLLSYSNSQKLCKVSIAADCKHYNQQTTQTTATAITARDLTRKTSSFKYLRATMLQPLGQLQTRMLPSQFLCYLGVQKAARLKHIRQTSTQQFVASSKPPGGGLLAAPLQIVPDMPTHDLDA